VSVRNQATLRVANPGLLGPVLTRVIGMLGARAQAPIDRLDDAFVVADTVAAHSPDHTLDGTVVVALTTEEDGLELAVQDLRPNGARALLADADLPGVGNVLEQIADRIEVRGEGEAGEALVIRLGFSG
jgi:hypothetical protein